jgi:hypothetical protein
MQPSQAFRQMMVPVRLVRSAEGRICPFARLYTRRAAEDPLRPGKMGHLDHQIEARPKLPVKLSFDARLSLFRWRIPDKRRPGWFRR